MYQTIIITFLVVKIIFLLILLADKNHQIEFHKSMSVSRLKACNELTDEISKLKNKPANKTTQELLHDLTVHGSALIEIKLIDKNNLFIWNK